MTCENPRKCAGESIVFLLQDMRLYEFNTAGDSVMCNDEKLSAESSDSFVGSCKEFFKSTVFGKGTDWPTVVVAPSHLVDSDDSPNLAIEVSKRPEHRRHTNREHVLEARTMK